MLPIILFLATQSHAHRPHAVVTAVAPGSERHWALMDPHDVSQLMTSTNGGRHWDHRPTPAMESPLTSALVDSEDRLHLLSTDGTHFWQGTDGNWNQETLSDPSTDPLVARDLAAIQGTLIFATTRGVIFIDTAGSTDLFEPSFIVATGLNVTCDNDCTLLVVGGSGGLWRAGGLAPDGTWDPPPELLPLQALPGGRKALSVQEIGGEIFAGSDDGVLRSQDEGSSWEICGSLPSSHTAEHSDAVPALAVGASGEILAGSGREALFLSEDRCDSWEILQTGLEVVYGGTGNATDPEQAWVHLSLSDSTGLVAGFAGAGATQDGGSTWTNAALLRNRYTRAVAVSGDWPSDTRVFVGGYGGGVTWTEDGGTTWRGSAVGLDPEVVAYDLLSVPGTADTLLYAGLSGLFRSTDGGEHWDSVRVPMDRARAVRAIEGVLYLLGEDVSQGLSPVLGRSTDNGATWSSVPAFGVAVGTALPRHLFSANFGGEELLLAVTDVPAGLWGSRDGGASWEEFTSGEHEPASGAAVVSTAGGERMVFASPSGGVEILEEDASEWRPAAQPPQGTPRRLVAGEDEDIWLATRGGTLWRSVDGGDGWFQVGDRLSSAIHDLVPIPDDSGVLLLATQEGALWTDGQAMYPLSWLERLENGGVFLTCDGSPDLCPVYEDELQGAGGGIRLQAGESLRFSTEGTDLSLLAGGDAEWEFWVDEELLDANGFTLALPDGWKDVELVVTAGELRVDAVESRGGQGVAFAVPADTGGPDTGESTPDRPKDAGRCGNCATGGSPRHHWRGAWFLLILLAGQARRR